MCPSINGTPRLIAMNQSGVMAIYVEKFHASNSPMLAAALTKICKSLGTAAQLASLVCAAACS